MLTDNKSSYRVNVLYKITLININIYQAASILGLYDLIKLGNISLSGIESSVCASVEISLIKKLSSTSREYTVEHAEAN